MDNFESKPVADQVLTIDEKEKIMSNEQGFFRSNRIILILLFLAIVSLSALGYYMFFGSNKQRTSEAKINLEIKSSSESKAGESGLYQIIIQNKDTEVLSGSEIELVLPSGGEVVESSLRQKGLSKNIFLLPEMNPEEVFRLDFRISFDGSVGENVPIEAILYYKFKGSNLVFKRSEKVNLSLKSGGVTVSMAGPKEAVINQLSVFNVNYVNESNVDIGEARIRVRAPLNFKIESTEPESKEVSKYERVFALKELKKGDKGTLIFQGSFEDGSDSNPAMAVYVENLKDDGKFGLISEFLYDMSLSDQPLSVNISAPNKNSFDAGEEITFSITAKNNSKKVISNVEVDAFLEGASLDMSSITSDQGFAKDSKISFGAIGEERLAKILPGESQSLEFRVKVKNPPVKDSTKNLVFNLTSKIKSSEYPLGFEMAKKTFKINSKLTPTISLTHVQGPLPLEVGQRTKYRVTLNIRSGSNDIKDVQLAGSLKLPKGSFVANSVSTDEKELFVFTESTGKFIWKAGFVPAYSGVFTPLRSVSFDIDVTPSQSASGQSIDLVRALSYQGKDSYTNKEFTGSLPDISTRNATGNAGDNGYVK